MIQNELIGEGANSGIQLFLVFKTLDSNAFQEKVQISYCPELSPAEKVWWLLKREIKMRTFKTIKEIQAALSDAIKKLITKEAMKQLTGFSYYQNIV